jgi:two-component system, OmpR family, response regulator
VNTENKIKLFLVDDDVVLLKALEIEFLNEGNFEVETFPTGELCLENLHKNPEMVILDYHLDGIQEHAMNGLQTLDGIKKFNSQIPVIMLSSQDKIEVAINCMHYKASDYVVKSETSFFRLQKIISDIVEQKKIEKQLNWYMDRM